MNEQVYPRKLLISGPGSCGELNVALTRDQLRFLERLAVCWNDSNGFVAQPYITLEQVDPAGGKFHNF